MKRHSGFILKHFKNSDKLKRFFFLFWIFVLFVAGAKAEEKKTIHFSSSEKQAQLVELYTSHGCSSCPPAERWLNNFISDKELFRSVIPVAFHVDYWNYIGWKDTYASADFSNRQRNLNKTGVLRSVYTPAFVVAGREWRGWFAGEKFPRIKKINAGVLSGSINQGMLKVTFSKGSKGLILHLALLANGTKERILRGENGGKVLKGDFIVIDYSEHVSKTESWEFPMPQKTVANAESYALAVWITEKNSFSPIQAAGTRL